MLSRGALKTRILHKYHWISQGNQRFVFGARKVFLASYIASRLYTVCQEFKFCVFIIYCILLLPKISALICVTLFANYSDCFCVSELLFIRQFVWASTLT